MEKNTKDLFDYTLKLSNQNLQLIADSWETDKLLDFIEMYVNTSVYGDILNLDRLSKWRLEIVPKYSISIDIFENKIYEMINTYKHLIDCYNLKMEDK